ncbi:hypothetical protein BCR39DRAFT_546010 [Naematelia encephala]|uniref:Cryptic loci regulator 2 N-terminal domain-containing protein n=1 Tax=Naematelia encephala TaxID=71784 RepID=A0A1Y2AQR6_9TREE|nr:hypothetical protein BCR39DRAFT_546010 [Naematelia encephala]
MVISTHPRLVWPRSDGSEKKWPAGEELRISYSQAFYTKLDPNDEKYTLYHTKTGQHLADVLGIPKLPGTASHRIHLPTGYALFAHNKPQSDKRLRTDVYLYGSIHALKFRSPAEFFEHAEWLMDETRDINDHSTCGCKYNSASALAQARKSSSIAGPSKRTHDSNTPRRSKKPNMDEIDSDEDERTPIVAEREIDMTTARRFRKGELVWFRTATVNPPTKEGVTSGSPSITHWPGLIAHTILRTSSTVSPANGEVTYHEYHVRPLGSFSFTNQVVRHPADLLPWALGNELLGGAKGWEVIGKECTRVITEGVKAELEEDKSKGVALPNTDDELKSRWEAKWARRIPFRELEEDWDKRVFRLGIALKTAGIITDSWTQTDKINVLPSDQVNEDDLKAIISRAKSLYQGMWWGGERIWLEDMVRLKKFRGDLPTDVLAPPSEGALERAVLLRVRLMIQPRMITIESSGETSDGKSNAYQCLLYGDVFELKATNGTGATLETLPAGNDSPIGKPHVPPKGYEYRQLNDPGSEVTVDIMDVAGRIYPDLLEPQTQNWFKDPSFSEQENDKRVTPGTSALALVGLKPGPLVASKSEKWKDDLYTIVLDATNSVDKATRAFYRSLLKVEDKPEVTNGSIGNGNGNGSLATTPVVANMTPAIVA